jgi:hypothetical protein
MHNRTNDFNIYSYPVYYNIAKQGIALHPRFKRETGSLLRPLFVIPKLVTQSPLKFCSVGNGAGPLRALASRAGGT